MMSNEREDLVIYYDEDCNLCQRAVRFIQKRDSKNQFTFLALQSDQGKIVSEKMGLTHDAQGSLVLMEGDQGYLRSDAALRIASRLDAPWPAANIFRILPRFLRDRMYNWIARNRYRWFGRANDV